MTKLRQRMKFIHRFLQHVLPHRFIKVRYYGLLSPANRHLIERARQPLAATSNQPAKTSNLTAVINSPSAIGSGLLARTALRCPHCDTPLTLLGPLKPKARSP